MASIQRAPNACRLTAGGLCWRRELIPGHAHFLRLRKTRLELTGEWRCVTQPHSFFKHALLSHTSLSIPITFFCTGCISFLRYLCLGILSPDKASKVQGLDHTLFLYIVPSTKRPLESLHRQLCLRQNSGNRSHR